MNIWGITDTGMVRKQNQDSYTFDICNDPPFELCVICDGMGGAKAGNVASSIAVEQFSREIKSGYKEGMTPDEIAQLGKQAASVANEAVYIRAAKSDDYAGMGTTLVAAITYYGGVVVFNVGDSRAYRINDDGITRITKDHSVVQDMVECGEITEEEALTHPNRNFITRAIGTEKKVKCDAYIEQLKNGEYILLCSDGLVNTVTEQEMLYEVIHGSNRELCLERLLEISKLRGAPDNVTAVLMQYEKKGV